ncbi:hypothetical protein EDD93_3682 [Streptomyces sp. 840.1]|uniref:hypothetical protein n=1 Tax=Streptomyces sp. 840.1 TaxID=2485152 RepID=UPI000F4809EC|nr:hypothetical protein [Streptomyces sp. 840.1]ROQ69185.1 hypothetical protein EDD93_3682 [Streptomyces sp. 840.1]
MAVPSPVTPFIVRLADGRTWSGAEFPGGFVCVHTPDEYGACIIATSTEHLLADRTPEDPLHGARIEHYE